METTHFARMLPSSLVFWFNITVVSKMLNAYTWRANWMSAEWARNERGWARCLYTFMDLSCRLILWHILNERGWARNERGWARMNAMPLHHAFCLTCVPFLPFLLTLHLILTISCVFCVFCMNIIVFPRFPLFFIMFYDSVVYFSGFCVFFCVSVFVF